jgi:hypothetical protein
MESNTKTVKLYIGGHNEFVEEINGQFRTFRVLPGSGKHLWAMPADYVPAHIYRTINVVRQKLAADRWTYDGVEYDASTI